MTEEGARREIERENHRSEEEANGATAGVHPDHVPWLDGLQKLRREIQRHDAPSPRHLLSPSSTSGLRSAWRWSGFQKLGIDLVDEDPLIMEVTRNDVWDCRWKRRSGSPSTSRWCFWMEDFQIWMLAPFLHPHPSILYSCSCIPVAFVSTIRT